MIGDTAPIGLCGTAYIDFVARARQIGLITATARFASPDTAGVIKHPTHGWSFEVAPGQSADPLLITEADMASLLQAKAAIAAGVICLLQRAGIDSSHVSTVYLAGGFGFHMHVDSLLGCGMLPGFRPDQIELVGNTSLGGATSRCSTAARSAKFANSANACRSWNSISNPTSNPPTSINSHCPAREV